MTTRYEIIAVKGERRHQVALTARRTKRSLIWNTVEHAAEIVAALQADRDAVVTAASVEAIHFADGTVVRWSGRTELDILNEEARA